MKNIHWDLKPKEKNFEAAKNYLSLIYNFVKVGKMVTALRFSSKISRFMAKDIFRASGLSLLGISNNRVQEDLKKIKEGEPLSPILLVRDEIHGKVIVADGYHRLCALYQHDENEPIECVIV